MKVAAGGGGEVMVEVRLPEVFGDEVNHSLFGLQGPGDAEEGGGFGQGSVPREDLGPEDNIHEAGLVLQRHECDALGGAGLLAADDEAGVAHARSMAHRGYCVGVREPLRF